MVEIGYSILVAACESVCAVAGWLLCGASSAGVARNRENAKSNSRLRKGLENHRSEERRVGKECRL